MENDIYEEWEIDIEEEPEELALDSQWCIYKVPESLRRLNAKAYTPRFISIGPFHHGNAKLSQMEDYKIKYLKDFLQKRISTRFSNTHEMFLSKIEQHKERIRHSYAESTLKTINDSKFILMVLYDAIFIIEFFLRSHQWDEYYKKDMLLTRSWLNIAIKQDLRLLENQLPFFILEELYNIAFPAENNDYPSFLDLSYNFFDEVCLDIPNGVKVKHFTDLVRRVQLTNHLNAPGIVSYVHNVTKLQDAGVNYKAVLDRNLLDIKFEKTDLIIPQLRADAGTECYLRNLMALEQCHYREEAYVCNYIKLLHFLVKTEKDVELLVEKSIVVNELGHSGAVKDMLDKLCLEIIGHDSWYYELAMDLNAHYDSFWNHTITTLKRVYFNNMWRGTATVTAIIVLVLTFIQTVCSIIQVVKMK